MKKLQILLYLILFPILVSGQNISTIDIRLRDGSTKGPLAFVNVGFVDKALGSVSDEKGDVNLIFYQESIVMSDVIQFSVIGYHTKQYTFKELIDILKKNNIIYLDKKVYDLTEVSLVRKWGKKQSFGTSKTDPGVLGSWKERKALGGEIATRINLPRGRRKLIDATFKVSANTSDSIMVRINVYDYKSRHPSKNLLNTSIFETIKVKSGDYTIDLSPYNIVVDNDVVLSVELIKVYGGDVGFALAGGNGSCTSFLRYVSQDKWVVLKGKCIALSVNTRPYLDNEESKEKSSFYNFVTVYWDASWSSKDRDIKKELEFLKKFIEKAQVKSLTISPFSHELMASSTFNIDGNFDAIENYIKEIKALGATSYENLKFNVSDTDAYLLFSDGVVTLNDTFDVYSNAPLFTISNDQKKIDQRALELLSDQNDGRFIPLENFTTQKAVERLLAPEGAVFANMGKEDDSYFKINGSVTHNEVPLQKCYVSIKDSFESAVTDSLGKFVIQAKLGDILQFEYPAMLYKEVLVKSEAPIKVQLNSEYEILTEVVLNDKGKKLTPLEEEVRARKRKVGAQHYIDYTEFPKSATYLSDLIRGRIPGVRVIGSGSNAEYSVRANSTFLNGQTASPLFVVDGIITLDVPNYIFISDIESIGVDLTSASLAQYGRRAANGVILIQLKRGSTARGPSALVVDNDFKDPVLTYNYNQDLTAIAQRFKAKNASEAYAAFCEVITSSPTDLTVYLAYFDHIRNNPNSNPAAVLTTLVEVAPQNVRVLRALAYYLEKEKYYSLANDVYAKVLKIVPDEFQSYIDIARVQVMDGKYNEGFEIYKMLILNEFVDFKLDPDAQKLVYREIKYLLTKYRDKVNFSDVPDSFLESLQYIDVRYVLTWNNPQLEFEAQIVNPQKKFFTYNHSIAAADNDFNDDLTNGIMTQEIVIDDDKTPGVWLLNLKSVQQGALRVPGFLKLETFINYGKSEQEYKVEVIPLEQLDRNYTVSTHTF